MEITYKLPRRQVGPDHRMELEPVVVEKRPPRIACMLALAHRFQMLVETGQVKDYAELARLGYVTRARLSQIMKLLFLAPRIQERLLFWPTEDARFAPTERDLRRTVHETYWNRQERIAAARIPAN